MAAIAPLLHRAAIGPEATRTTHKPDAASSTSVIAADLTQQLATLTRARTVTIANLPAEEEDLSVSDASLRSSRKAHIPHEVDFTEDSLSSYSASESRSYVTTSQASGSRSRTTSLAQPVHLSSIAVAVPASALAQTQPNVVALPNDDATLMAGFRGTEKVFSFAQFLKVGFPVLCLSLATANVYLVVVFSVLGLGLD
eukprot:gnl/Ergobibamus_cyprinoides/1434.p1 GENE.gnl/Ergobibamus_cyprinoides/1434~~gnl/Ergobibamus_cyprinoides/1434.p1  ORF type:complete len:218 (+),score=3.90 gnl/Ergobibamus_cyprinoides/1434:61-654(+)